MKLAAVKLSSEFVERLFRRDSPNEWRPPRQCENGVEKTAIFLRAVNDGNGVTLIFGDDADPRFFKLDEGAAVPAIGLLYNEMGNGSEVINALKRLRSGSREEHSGVVFDDWKFVAEAFRLDDPPEAWFRAPEREKKTDGA